MRVGGVVAGQATQKRDEAHLPCTKARKGSHSCGKRASVTKANHGVPTLLDLAPQKVRARDAKGAHIVADGIGFTNECRVDPTGKWLYVNETTAKRVSQRASAVGSPVPRARSRRLLSLIRE